jgi:hydroxyacylglutathione hydrolase
MALEILQRRCGADNIAILAVDRAAGAAAAIDAGDAEAVIALAEAAGVAVTEVLVTHRHGDHIAGIPALTARFPALWVIAPAKARAAVPGAHRFVGEGDRVAIGEAEAIVWETPGHCADHVAYVLPAEGIAFVGDTLFALGCGRVFEDTMETMYASLMRLAALPAATTIYCGHDYTLANGRFALTVEPGNAALRRALAEAEAKAGRGELTTPSTIGAENAANPFLRAGSAARFAALRDAKNAFRG